MYSLDYLPVDFSIKLKDKFHSRTSHEDPDVEWKYSYILSLTLAVDWGWVVKLTLRLLYPWKREQIPFTKEAESAPRPAWTSEENLAQLGFDLRTVQPIASSYTDYAIPAHFDRLIAEHVCIVSSGKIVPDIKCLFLPLQLLSEIIFRGMSMNLLCVRTWSPVLEKYMYFGDGITQDGGHCRCDT